MLMILMMATMMLKTPQSVAATAADVSAEFVLLVERRRTC